ncbi:MAG: hypothetical protein RMJ97_07275 [Raineya sp.]|nr:hypothetical protein [Raineya sp.]MDW8296672.1 hypothetical protein [Raineya sp.]
MSKKIKTAVTTKSNKSSAQNGKINSAIRLGILKGKIKIAPDAFEENNRKTLKF